jgi:hypothetical protein
MWHIEKMAIEDFQSPNMWWLKISVAKLAMTKKFQLPILDCMIGNWNPSLWRPIFFLMTIGLATKICFRSPIVRGQPKCEQGFSYIHLDGCIIKMDANVMFATKWVHHISLTTLMRCCPRIEIPILI